MNARMGEACTSRKPKPGLGTRPRINVNIALGWVQTDMSTSPGARVWVIEFACIPVV